MLARLDEEGKAEVVDQEVRDGAANRPVRSDGPDRAQRPGPRDRKRKRKFPPNLPPQEEES